MINVKTENRNFSNNRFVKARVVYEDINNHDQIVRQEIVSGPIHSLVERKRYQNRVPHGYQFVGFGNFYTKLNDGDVNVIYVKRVTTPSLANRSTQATGLIKIDYVDANNQLVAHRSFTKPLGTIFHLHKQARNVPSGYHFKCVLVGGNVTAFNRDTQIVVVALGRAKIKSRIFIEYFCNGHQISRTAAKGLVGNHFDIDKYRHQLPDHTHFVKFLNPVPDTFGKHDVTVKIKVAKPVSVTSKQKNLNHQTSFQHSSASNTAIKNAQSLGQVLSKIGTSLNSLGKIIQAQHSHNQNKPND